MNEPKPQPRDIMSETLVEVWHFVRAPQGWDVGWVRHSDYLQLERALTQAQADLGLERESHEVTKRMLDDADHELTEGRARWAKDLELANQAQARCAEVEKDAARYRWLREASKSFGSWKVSYTVLDERERPERRWLHEEALDEAIDAALKEPR